MNTGIDVEDMRLLYKTKLVEDSGLIANIGMEPINSYQ